MRGSGDKEQWLLIKERDDGARSESEFDVLDALRGSVMSDDGRKTKRKVSGRAKHATTQGELARPATSRKKRGNATAAAQQPDTRDASVPASMRRSYGRSNANSTRTLPHACRSLKRRASAAAHRYTGCARSS